MHHVAGVGDAHVFAVAKTRQALREVGIRVAAVPALNRHLRGPVRVRAARGDDQRRTLQLLPAQAVQFRVGRQPRLSDALIELPVPLAVGRDRGAVIGEPQRTLARQRGVVGVQALGGELEARQRPRMFRNPHHREQLFALADAPQLGVDFLRPRRRPEPFDDHERAHFLGKQRCVMRADVAAETVADDDRAVEAERFDDAVQVVDELPDRVRARVVAVAVAAQLRQHHVVTVGERLCDHEQARGDVADAVHDHQRRVRRITERQDVQRRAGGRDALVAGLCHCRCFACTAPSGLIARPNDVVRPFSSPVPLPPSWLVSWPASWPVSSPAWPACPASWPAPRPAVV